jgi:hypothetical protein
MSKDDFKQLLKAIQLRPAMYWGDSDYLFTSLIAFISGYQSGYAVKAHEHESTVGESYTLDFTPKGFHKFVENWYNIKNPGGWGWMTYIQMNTNSEREAFDTYFRLREEYDKAQEHTS